MVLSQFLWALISHYKVGAQISIFFLFFFFSGCIFKTHSTVCNDSDYCPVLVYKVLFIKSCTQKGMCDGSREAASVDEQEPSMQAAGGPRGELTEAPRGRTAKSHWATAPYTGPFLLSYDNIPGKATEAGRFISVRVQSSTVQKAWWKKREAAGHVIFIVRKQRGVNAGGSHGPSHFHLVWDPSPWNGTAHTCGELSRVS